MNLLYTMFATHYLQLVFISHKPIISFTKLKAVEFPLHQHNV